jgi:hypothetical protein
MFSGGASGLMKAFGSEGTIGKALGGNSSIGSSLRSSPAQMAPIATAPAWAKPAAETPAWMSLFQPAKNPPQDEGGLAGFASMVQRLFGPR